MGGVKCSKIIIKASHSPKPHWKGHIYMPSNIIIPDNLISYQNELYHYGTPRHSGRYPWGSGERPYQGDGIIRSSRLRSYEKKKEGAELKKVSKSITSIETPIIRIQPARTKGR